MAQEKDKLLQKLLNKEISYNEEIHNLIVGEKEVSFIPAVQNAINGWVCTLAKKQDSDWNLAKFFGKPEDSETIFPLKAEKDDLHFLIEEEFCSNISSDFKFQDSLYWFTNEGVGGDNLFRMPEIIFEENLIIAPQTRPIAFGDFSFNYFSVYLLKNGVVKGFARTNHETPHSFEVYIEVEPQYRNKGIGKALMNEVLKFSMKNRKKLIYVCEKSNLPSLKLAESLELKKFNTFNRYSV